MLELCRICLDTNVRLHRISGSEVQDVFEMITNDQVQEDGALYSACFICYRQLQNCQQLVAKSHKSEMLLKHILKTSNKLNLESFNYIDRLASRLIAPLLVTDVQSLQIPESDYVTGYLYDNEMFDDIPEDVPDDDSIQNKESKEENMFKQDECSIENENTSISTININTVPAVHDSFEIEQTERDFDKQVICNECGKSFDTKSGLIRHIHRHKPGIINLNDLYKNTPNYINSEIPDSLKNISFSLTSDNQYKCHYCNYTSKRKYIVQKHIKTHTGERPFKCQICSYAFLTKWKLKMHIRTHTGEKPFKCSYCTFACSDDSQLKYHIRIHTKEKLVQCEYCSYSCIKPSYLKRHVRTHTGEKPYKCQYCDYACAFKNSLQYHNIMKHATKEIPFKCQYCSYKTVYSSHLKVHITTHTKEKPFICHYCNYACATKAKLKKHIQIHTRENIIKCRYCDYTCATKPNLKKHIKTHTDENTFKCQYCNFTTLLKYRLNVHIRTHTGEKPFKCQYCKYKTAEKAYLRKHIKIHMKDNHLCELCGKKYKIKIALERHVRAHMKKTTLK